MNPCRICGADTNLFTEIYDPNAGKAADIYLCPEHHRRLLAAIRREIAHMLWMGADPDRIGNCRYCGHQRGWDDQGFGVGEWICALDDTPEGCPECEGNGPCPGWIPQEGSA